MSVVDSYAASDQFLELVKSFCSYTEGRLVNSRFHVRVRDKSLASELVWKVARLADSHLTDQTAIHAGILIVVVVMPCGI